MITQLKALVRRSSDVSSDKLEAKSLLHDERGAGMTEYIILVGVIAMLAIVAFRFFGSSVSQKINDQAGTVQKIEVGSGP
jgi:Flp pilus assembly pilin Flp